MIMKATRPVGESSMEHRMGRLRPSRSAGTAGRERDRAMPRCSHDSSRLLYDSSRLTTVYATCHRPNTLTVVSTASTFAREPLAIKGRGRIM